MNIIRSKKFITEQFWVSIEIDNIGGITTRLHWTDQPYKCHINDGEEVFAVNDGQVEAKIISRALAKPPLAGNPHLSLVGNTTRNFLSVFVPSGGYPFIPSDLPSASH